MILGVLPILASCAPQVTLPSPAMPLPATFETQDGRLATEIPNLDRWWTGFGDPQLEHLVDTALASSTTSRMAFARLSEARAGRRAAKADNLPSGGLTGDIRRQRNDLAIGSVGIDGQQLALDASWEADVFGRLRASSQRADFEFQASSLDYYATRIALAGDVATALFRTRLLMAQREEAENAARISRDLRRVAALGRDRGLVAANDVMRLEADLASREAESARLALELRDAKRSLLILIGKPTSPTENLAIEGRLGMPPPIPAIAPGLLLTRRPDILAAEFRLRSAAKTVDVDRLALFPKINLRPGVGLASSSASVGSANLFWSLVGGISMPVLDRTRLIAQLRISEARGHQAVIAYEQSVQSAFGEADSALAGISAANARTVDLERAARLSQVAFDGAKRRYQASLIDLTTLLQVEDRLVGSRRALAEARAEFLIETVNAFRALGGGWDLALAPPGDSSFSAKPGSIDGE